MRSTVTLIALLAAAAAAALHAGRAPSSLPGFPTWALFSFAVSAFRGPVR